MIEPQQPVKLRQRHRLEGQQGDVTQALEHLPPEYAFTPEVARRACKEPQQPKKRQMDEKRCKNATIGKCPDEECPHFWEHEKRFDCHLDCNSFIEDDTPCEAVKPEPIEPKISPYALPSQACDEYFTPPEPQQPDKRLEQKVRGLLDRLGEGVFQGKIYLNLREDVVQAILTAMCQYQQPAIDLSTMEKIICECGHSMQTHCDGDGCCDRSGCGCKQFAKKPEPQQPEQKQDEKLRDKIVKILAANLEKGSFYYIKATNEIEQAFRDAQPEGRIAKMLKYGGRVRLWHDQRFLDWDTISHEWVVMDSQGNKGLGCSLYVGKDLDKALDVLEREGK